MGLEVGPGIYMYIFSYLDKSVLVTTVSILYPQLPFCIGSTITNEGLKQVILDQCRQNRYQTVPFGMYIHNLMFVLNLE